MQKGITMKVNFISHMTSAIEEEKRVFETQEKAHKNVFV